MNRLHVNLSVGDLAESIRFYTMLFDTPPTLTKPDYAKWMLDDPRVNFAIVEAPSGKGELGIEHLGIEAESEAELGELRRRIAREQDRVFDEGDTICCYHASDKAWITDPQEVSWELFHTSAPAHQMRLQNPADSAAETRAAGEVTREGQASTQAPCCETSCCP